MLPVLLASLLGRAIDLHFLLLGKGAMITGVKSKTPGTGTSAILRAPTHSGIGLSQAKDIGVLVIVVHSGRGGIVVDGVPDSIRATQ